MFKNVYPREKYLNKIRPFYDSDIINDNSLKSGTNKCGLIDIGTMVEK